MELKPGYKQTEVGVIPEDWDCVPIGEITDLRVGRDLRPELYAPYGDSTYRYPVYSNTVTNRGLYGYYSFPEYDGESFTVVGRGVGLGTAFSRKGGFGAIGRLLVLITDQRSDADYLATFINERVQIFVETGGIPQLTGVQFGKYRVALPPPYEQRVIATALSDVDALLDGLDLLIAKKRDLKQAAMQQLLTGETRLPGFEGEWKPLNMAQDSTLKARIGWQGLTTAEYLESGQYALVTGTDFFDGKIDWDSCHFVEKKRYDQDRYIQLQINDVLLTKDGTIGKAAFLDKLPYPATLNSGVFVIRPKNGSYIPKYFFYVLRSQIFVDFLNKLQAGSTISHLYQKDFVNFEFLAPETVEEQSAISAVLSDMDAEIAALEQRRNKTKDIKQAMMQELLTGKTRLVTPGGSNA